MKISFGPTRTLAASAVALAISLSGGGTAAHAGETLDATKAFERLKGLAGRWEGTGGEAGKPGDPMVVEYAVTSGGTAVMETLFAGQPYEMITVFTLDGADLIATHYCSGGNQPHYRFKASGLPDQVTMDFDGGTSLDVSKDAFIHDVRYDLSTDGKVRAELTNYAGGKAAGKIQFDVAKK
jgi:hypothetical protein